MISKERIVFFVSLWIIINYCTIASCEEWTNTYGGQGYDAASQIIATQDGGYAIIGITNSFEALGYDLWVIKIDKNGEMEWNKLYGGRKDDFGYFLLQTDDEEYIALGATNSSFDNNSDFDILMIKIDSSGNVKWFKTLGNTTDEQAISIIKTNQLEYAILGIAKNFDTQNSDFYLINTDMNGTMNWNKTYGGSKEEVAKSFMQSNDNGYAIVGYTTSYGAGKKDIWLIKTDQNGTMQWNKTYGGIFDDEAYAIIQTIDKGYAIAGYTASYGAGNSDFWLIKTDQNGTMQWNRTYGGPDDDGAQALLQTSDNGYALAGYSEVFLSYDFYLIKTNNKGFIQGTVNSTDDGDERAFSIIQNEKGNFVLAGYSHLQSGYNIYAVEINSTNLNRSNLSPISFAGNDKHIMIGETFTFEGTGFDPDGKIVKYLWDFDGDRVPDYFSNQSGIAKYNYKKDGKFIATLTVIDNNNSRAIDSIIVTVQSLEEEINSNNNRDSITLLLIMIFFIILFIFFYIINYVLKNKHCKLLNEPKKWITYLIFSSIFLISIKFLITLLFDYPWIYGDEFIYGYLAKVIYSGKFIILGEIPFASMLVPAGYSYFLSPAYLVGSNMFLVYHSMLFINSILSTLIIFPVFYIMKFFVDKKWAFATSLIIATLPSMQTYNVTLLSENAFFPFFLLSCALLVKTFSINRFNKSFIIYSVLLGFSVVFLITIRAIGIAIFAALLCTILYKIITKRDKSSLKYALIFIPYIFLIAGGFILYNKRIFTIGYSDSLYLEKGLSFFSNVQNLFTFFRLIGNEINYFIIMSYFIFFVFMIFLLIRLKEIKDDYTEKLKPFILFSLFSIIFLILITVTHIYQNYEIYTRYVAPGLPLVVMLGVIGFQIFIKKRNRRNEKIISFLFIISVLYFVLFFPEGPYKVANNLDLRWIVYLSSINLNGINLYLLFRIMLSFVTILIAGIILFNIKKKEEIYKIFNRIIKKPRAIPIIIIISSLLLLPTLLTSLGFNDISNYRRINQPAIWFMENDNDADIIVEDGFTAFSGGGMDLNFWQVMYKDLIFWVSEGTIEILNRERMNDFVLTQNKSADYILSTHDLTKYYTVIQDFSMNLPVVPMKHQDKVDWHIYKVDN